LNLPIEHAHRSNTLMMLLQFLDFLCHLPNLNPTYCSHTPRSNTAVMTLMRPKPLISSTNLNPTHLNLHSHPSITVMIDAASPFSQYLTST